MSTRPSIAEPVPGASGSRPLVWAAVLGAWTLVAVIDARRPPFYMHLQEPHLGWTDAVERSVPGWALWALLTPLVFAAAARFPLDRGDVRPVLPVHLAEALAVATA